MAFGVTQEGFVLKRYEDIRTEFVDSLRNKFGNIRTDSQSKFGMLSDIISSKLSDVWAVAQDIYNSRSIAAEGTALDDIVYWSGLQRIAQSKSRMYVIMYGVIGTSVIPGTIIRCRDTGNQFVLDSLSAIQISSNSLGDAKISFILSGTIEEYTLSLDKTFTVVSDEDSIAHNIVDGFLYFINHPTTGSDVATAIDNGDGTLSIRSKDFSNAAVSIVLDTENMIFDKIGTAMPFIAQEYGSMAAPIGDASMIVTPIVGLDECFNFEAATLGREEETDTELRLRFLQVRSAMGYSTVDAVRNRILQEVNGVVNVVVYENPTDTTVDGMPPHSILVVADCPATIEQAVAEKIWQVKAAGILTHGNLNKTVMDSQGHTHVVKYSKVATVYAHVNVVITVSSEKAFPVNGTAIILESILAFGQSLNMGDDLIFQSFYRPVYSVSGIESVTLRIAVTANPGDAPSYGGSNIPVSKTTKVEFDLSRIHVSLA